MCVRARRVRVRLTFRAGVAIVMGERMARDHAASPKNKQYHNTGNNVLNPVTFMLI